MAKVEPYETTDEEVMTNRLHFRNYIRELILNQTRVMEKIAQAKAGEDGIQEMIEKLKSG